MMKINSNQILAACSVIATFAGYFAWTDGRYVKTEELSPMSHAQVQDRAERIEYQNISNEQFRQLNEKLGRIEGKLDEALSR